MSKKRKFCKWCGFPVVPRLQDGVYYCECCDHYYPEDRVYTDPANIFDRITKSVDTLAVEFVGMMFDRVAFEDRYYSMLTGEFYDSEEAALSATEAKLKEVSNG